MISINSNLFNDPTAIRYRALAWSLSPELSLYVQLKFQPKYTNSREPPTVEYVLQGAPGLTIGYKPEKDKFGKLLQQQPSVSTLFCDFVFRSLLLNIHHC